MQQFAWTIIAALVVSIGALGWKSPTSYKRLQGMVGSAVIPTTLFGAGIVLGSYYGPSKLWVSATVMLAPSALWLAIWSWGTVCGELREHDRASDMEKGGATDTEKQRPDKNPE